MLLLDGACTGCMEKRCFPWISLRLLPLAGGSMTSETEEVMVQHMPYTSGMAPSPQRKAGGAEKLRLSLENIGTERSKSLLLFKW